MNQNLLLDTQLCSIMTDGDQKDEADTGVILPYHATYNFVEINDAILTLDP